ncbi:MAG: hypothetical protein RKR03_16860 [Candidatus Competibacter sp.]|nr:hypothetical protein [Candidatus Competibacter sp.]
MSRRFIQNRHGGPNILGRHACVAFGHLDAGMAQQIAKMKIPIPALFSRPASAILAGRKIPSRMSGTSRHEKQRD